MTHDLKVLGLALIATVAMTWTVASSAFGLEEQGTLTSDGPVTLDGTELAGKTNALTAFGARTECPGSRITGNKTLTEAQTEAGKKHERISGFTTSMTVSWDPAQENCKTIDGSGTHKSTVTLNGCDLDVSIGLSFPGFPVGVRVDPVCPAEKDIQVDVYAFSGSELGGIQCTITVKPQTGLTGPTLTTNSEADDVTMEGTLTSVVVSRSGAACATEESTSGEWHFNTTLTGTNEAGETTGVTVTF